MEAFVPKPWAPEIEDQYETLFDQVWESERREGMNDDIDNAVRVEEEREKRRKKAE
jgi:hypothetical protein